MSRGCGGGWLVADETTRYTGPWAPGMLYTDDDGSPVRIVNVPALPEYPENAIGDGMAPGVATHDDGLTWYIFGDDGKGAPDRNDPATVGAFLGAVREAFGEPLMFVRPAAGGWMVYRVANPGLIERDEVLLTSGQWFDAAEWGNVDDPIRGATEWDATEAAWNVRPGVKRG